MKFYYEPNICAKCRGAYCCKVLPGSYAPSDIKCIFPSSSLKESIELALRTGKISIDWWEDSPPLPFLRPATKNNINGIYDPSWGGECIFLNENGCTLSWEERPYFCKTVEPMENFKCKDHIKKGNSKLAAAKMWRRTGLDLFQWRKENSYGN